MADFWTHPRLIDKVPAGGGGGGAHWPPRRHGFLAWSGDVDAISVAGNTVVAGAEYLVRLDRAADRTAWSPGGLVFGVHQAPSGATAMSGFRLGFRAPTGALLGSTDDRAGTVVAGRNEAAVTPASAGSLTDLQHEYVWGVLIVATQATTPMQLARHAGGSSVYPNMGAAGTASPNAQSRRTSTGRTTLTPTLDVLAQPLDLKWFLAATGADDHLIYASSIISADTIITTEGLA